MKISIVLTIIMCILTLLGSLAGTSYYYVKSIDSVQGQVYEHLESVAQSRAHHIEKQIKMEKELIESLALIEKVEDILLASKDDSDYNNKILLVNERLQKTVDSINQIMSISVLDKSGTIIAGTNSLEYGKDKSDDERISIINQGSNSAISDIHFDSEEQPAIGLASPVNVNNEIIGFVFMRINLEKALFPILLDKTGLGETGETYLINKDFYAVSPLLSVEDAVLKWKINTINSKNCLEMRDEQEEHIGHKAIEVFLDYSGQKVIGAHHMISGTNWCLLAEINEEEILGKQRAVFQKVTLIIIITLTLIITLLGFIIGKFIDKRIILKKGSKML